MPEKALSIRQPWAWLIVKGIKDVENRSWNTKFRGRVFVHASKKYDYEAMASPLLTLRVVLDVVLHYQDIRGAIIGEVDIVDCRYRFGDELDKLYSPWHDAGMYGFILANPVEYANPIPCKGQLGFFKVGEELRTVYSPTFRDG